MNSLDLTFKIPKKESSAYTTLMVIGIIAVYLGAFVVNDGFTLFIFSSIAEFIFIYKAKRSVLKWISILLFTPLILIALYLIVIFMIIGPAFGLM